MNQNTPPSSPVSMQCPGAPRKLPVIIEELNPYDIEILLNKVNDDRYKTNGNIFANDFTLSRTSSIGSNSISDENNLSRTLSTINHIYDENSTNGNIIEREDNGEEVSSHCKLT